MRGEVQFRGRGTTRGTRQWKGRNGWRKLTLSHPRRPLSHSITILSSLVSRHSLSSTSFFSLYASTQFFVYYSFHSFSCVFLCKVFSSFHIFSTPIIFFFHIFIIFFILLLSFSSFLNYIIHSMNIFLFYSLGTFLFLIYYYFIHILYFYSFF